MAQYQKEYRQVRIQIVFWLLTMNFLGTLIV